MAKRVAWSRVAPYMNKQGTTYFPCSKTSISFNGYWIKAISITDDGRMVVHYMDGYSENKKPNSRYRWAIYNLTEVDF